ncbi:hypothetical protein PDENDC454_04324 [Paenibacillus dendritiformis C454]|uniref:Uncharacterized protein n=2 Tax=Paenibacillus dendritiformis TaxID=130049 RepID=H3SBH9_9BACL|nr:hypothetical protein PDENDC454_04324 [Paenibacillus dendritiformis C454]
MILGELKEKVGQVDNKLSHMDRETLAVKMLKRPLEEFQKEILQEMKSISSLSSDEADKIIEDKMNKLSIKLKDELVEQFEKVETFTNKSYPDYLMFGTRGVGKTVATLDEFKKNIKEDTI